MNDNSHTPTGSYKKEVIHIVFDLGEGRQVSISLIMKGNHESIFGFKSVTVSS